MTPGALLRLAAALLIAAAGGALADLAGIPAAWLCGSMVAVTAASLFGMDTRLPLRLMHVIFLFLGVTLGAGVNPEVVQGVVSWPVSLAGLALTVAACIYGVRAFLIHVAGWDRDTAFFAAVPGALSYVLAVASDTRADIRRVAVSQSLRVVLLVALLPSIIVAVEAAPWAPLDPVVASWQANGLTLVGGAVAGLLFMRLRVPAAMLTGGLAVSAVVHGTGLVEGTLPQPVIIVAFVVLGAMIGSRFSGTDLRFLRRVLAASVGAFLVATTIAFVLSVAVAALVGESIDQVILAFAPGGLEAMTTMALALNMDTAFVAAHQLARFVGIALTLPFLARGALRRGREGEEGGAD